jgi:hypothetical protein
VTLGQPRREVSGKRQDVVGTLTQRQQGERGSREPIEQIRAEAAAADRVGEIGVCRGDDSNIQ